MTTGPSASFIPRKKGGKLSDIEFLSIKEFEGKLVTAEGLVTTTGDGASLTASSGKDLYLAGAKVSVKNGSVNEIFLVELKVNEITKESWGGESVVDTDFTTSVYKFNVKGLKVVTTQIIKIEVITNGLNIYEFETSLIGFEETTDASPQIPTI